MKLPSLLCALLLCSSLNGQMKTVKLSTISDFAKGAFDRVELTAVSDGELQLIHPLVQAGSDTLDASIERAVSYDEAGNYIQGWITSQKAYVQKFNAQHQAVSPAISVDDNGTVSQSSIAVALLNDGRFAVAWIELDAGSRFYMRRCQFFDASNAKIGGSEPIPGLAPANVDNVVAIADQDNKRFLFLGTERAGETYHAYAWMFSPTGAMLRDTIRLVPSSVTKHEFYIKGAYHNGRFAFVWEGNNTNVAPGDIYFMLADSNCIPLTQPILANADAPEGASPQVAIDNEGVCCITTRWMSDVAPEKIYARLYDRSGRLVSHYTLLTNLDDGGIDWHTIDFVDGAFRLRYGQGFSDGRPENRYRARWELTSVLSGNFVSNIFDAGSQQTEFGSLSWHGSTVPGTRLKFQLRSAATKEECSSAPWLGPVSTADYYTDAAGTTINAATSGKRYLQVKALFEADTNGLSPVLNDVSVTYRSADTTAPLPALSQTARGEHRRIVLEWEKSPSADVRSYRIYRATAAKNFDPDSFVLIPAQTAAFIDSSVSYDTTYRYGITAVDSTFNESAMAVTLPAAPKTMNIFVSTSGSAAGDGTPAKPFATIGQAITESFRGDTIYVLPGEYTEIPVMKPGTALIGSGASVTTLISSTNSNLTGALKTADHTLVKGFTFLAAYGIVGGGDDVTITENILIHQGSMPFEAGILPGTYEHVTISKNIIMNFGIGVRAVGTYYESPVEPIQVRNNIIYGQKGVENLRNNLVIANNTIIASGASGTGTAIDTWGGTTTSVMNNCLFGVPANGNHVRSILKSTSPFTTVKIEYNNRWNFDADTKDTISASNIAVDPQFVNAAKSNYHLGSASLCIDAGNPASDDNDKNGTRNDLGAYGGPDPLPDEMTFTLAARLSLTGSVGFPGDTVAVQIDLSNAAGLKKADFDILYHAAEMTLTDTRTATLTNGFTATVQGTQAGRRHIHLEGASEIASGSGTIATVRFLLNASLPGGTQDAVEIGAAELRDGENNRIVLSSIASTLITIQSPVAFPNRVYVDAGFTGTENGTILHPYRDVQSGIDQAKPGDTVIVAAGSYTGPIAMKSSVRVRGAGAAATTIRCPGDVVISMPAVIRFSNVHDSGIDHCALVNEASMGSVIDIVTSDVDIAMNKIDQSGMSINTIAVSAGSHAAIHDNYFVESTNGGFSMITSESESLVVARNVFVPSTPHLAIELRNNARASIVNNIFRSAMTAIEGTKTKHTIVANNLFTGSIETNVMVKLADAESTFVLNNIFDTRNIAITENGSSQQILNNIFYGNSTALIAASSTAHRSNCYWKNGMNLGSGQLDATEVAADPQFVDREKGNYRLAASSPLVDAGDPAPAWNDKDGTRNDIGIYGGPYADPSMFASGKIRLRIGSVSGTAGDTVTIPVTASAILGISGMQLMIEYDAQRLQLLSVHTTVATRSFTILQKNVGQSLAMVEMNGSEPAAIDSAAIAELVMRVLPKAEGSAYVRLQNASVTSGAAEKLSVDHVDNGTVDLTPLSVKGDGGAIPAEYALAQNYPNPFNPATTIRYQLPAASHVTLRIYNLLGQEIATLVDGMQKAGSYERQWDATRLASGIYIYRITAGSFVQSRKMMLLK